MQNYVIETFNVVCKIEVPSSSESTVKRCRRIANDLIDEINRHCDSHESVSLEYDGHYECSFCHSINPKDEHECCQKELAEWETKK